MSRFTLFPHHHNFISAKIPTHAGYSLTQINNIPVKTKENSTYHCTLFSISLFLCNRYSIADIKRSGATLRKIRANSSLDSSITPCDCFRADSKRSSCLIVVWKVPFNAFKSLSKWPRALISVFFVYNIVELYKLYRMNTCRIILTSKQNSTDVCKFEHTISKGISSRFDN